MLERLNEGCVVLEAMVEGLARFLSFGQRMVSCPEVVPQPHLAHTDKNNKQGILSCGTILIQIYLDTTILTRTAKVDLVLCTQQLGVNDQNLKSVSENWHSIYI